ncbi:MAG: hypothetical protein LDL33_05370 [Desulfomonile sp.]|nr:hypothetical protein [Desulfomonile sp.]
METPRLLGHSRNRRPAKIPKAAALVFCLLVALGAPRASAQSEGVCEAYHSEWVRVWKEIDEQMEEYARVKDESVAPRIEQLRAEHGARGSMARIVQAALQERSRRMTELRRKIQAHLDQERQAFDRWRVCASDSSRRAGGPARGNPEIQDRERRLARLSDLLLEEAHVQYKNNRAPVPADVYSYDAVYGGPARGREWLRQDQPALYNDRSRYGIEGYGGQLNRIPGYFR